MERVNLAAKPDIRPVLQIATRSSPLALWQAEWVQARLQEAGLPNQLLPFETQGDRILDRTLSKIGSKGVFTQELEESLLQGTAHIAVHSAKDMPSSLPAGLRILCFTEREEAEDVVVSYNPDFALDATRACVIGTSSTRRKAVLARHYPLAEQKEARGNLQTRLRKLAEGQYDALLLAYAGVHRIGQGALVRQHLPIHVFTPPVGQGALAIEIADTLPADVQARIRMALAHPDTETCLLAERTFLATIDGGCSIPSFGHARLEGNTLTLTAGIISLDGTAEVRVIESGPKDAAVLLGKRVADEVLGQGGKAILAEIRRGQQG
jgi:hydroxymethylbilane synthase